MANPKDDPADKAEQPLSSYDKEAPELKASVKQELLDATERTNDPTAIFTGGPPGSGKSRAVSDPLVAFYQSRGGLAIIDPDAIRPQFKAAEADMLKGQFSADGYRVSGTMAYELSLDLAINERRNVLHDGTLKDMHYPSIEMDQLHRGGVSVEIHCAVVYRELSRARTHMRAATEAADSAVNFGRTVDGSYHAEAVEALPRSLDYAHAKVEVQRIALYDDAGGKPFVEWQRQGLGGAWQVLPATHDKSPGETATVKQNEPTPQALVDVANTFIIARDVVIADELARRPTNTNEVRIRGMADEVTAAAAKVSAEPQAKSLASGTAVGDEVAKLAKNPLQPVADAWLRNPQGAAKAWPEHQAILSRADDGVKAMTAKGTPDKAAREGMAACIASGAASRALDAQKTPKEKPGADRTR